MSSPKGLICSLANPLYGEDVGYYNNGNYVNQFGLSDQFSGEDASCIASVPIVQRSDVLKASMAESLAASKGGDTATWTKVIDSLWSMTINHKHFPGYKKSAGNTGNFSGFSVDSVVAYCKKNPLMALIGGIVIYSLLKKFFK
jgi:hypothetical protein